KAVVNIPFSEQLPDGPRLSSAAALANTKPGYGCSQRLHLAKPITRAFPLSAGFQPAVSHGFQPAGRPRLRPRSACSQAVRAGFTLIELLVVIAIIAILAAMLL